MTNIEIKRITSLNQKTAGELATVYADAFRDPAIWDENTRCSTTGNFYGETTSVGEPCPCCNKPLLEAYPLEETIEYIGGELSRLYSIAFIGLIEDRITGASWGYVTTAEELANSKWKTNQMQRRVSSTLTVSTGPVIFYGSETFTAQNSRSLGLATRFQEERIAAASELQLPIVGRTLIGKPMARIYERLGYSQLEMVDDENPARALYVYLPKEDI